MDNKITTKINVKDNLIGIMRVNNKDYISLEKPIISPDENSKYLNLCSGCLKVYKLKDCYILTPEKMKDAKEDMCIMHPLPRVNEIAQDVDETPYAYYFKQAENGLYVRMAIISYLLGYR